MNNTKHLFIRACKREATERTPIWIMRQAGRYLSEYRAIREKTDFLTLCKTPELASEVTVQPVDIIGVDAAILFSDILVIPEAMGMHLEVLESKGPVFNSPIRSRGDLDRLNTEGVTERLSYVMDAIKLTKEKLADRVPLIGFSGAPWTLATYMVEGKGSKTFDKIKSLIYTDPATAHELLQVLADSVVDYLNAKIAAGCDAVQIFDTWAGILSRWDLEEFSLKYIRYICERLETNGAPVIVFAKGVNDLSNLKDIKCDVIGLDWTVDIRAARAEIGGTKTLQGNLDPCILFAPKEKIKLETERILERFGYGEGHIFNLGHGILPKTPVENTQYLVSCVKELSGKYHLYSTVMGTYGNAIDFEVLKKFNQQGPRYTSYPTAPLFSRSFTGDDYLREIAETNTKMDGKPLSLYFHFPFCEKLCYFCGCNMRVTRDRSLIAKYNAYLKKEIDLIRPMISDDRKIAQLHWGGGTPTYLYPDEIRDIGNYIKNNFEFEKDIEASVEIDPRGLTFQHMEALREIGFNRTSFGVQDFDLKVQKAINRVQSEEITRQTVTWTRDLGFQSINLDLIYGLPYQTVDSFADTVEKVIDISPNRIAVFNYAHVPWIKKNQSAMPADALPSPDERLSILQMTIETLIAAGYEYIGMDHFAKPTDELAIAQKNQTLYRNFQGYSTRSGCDVYAFGVSAISQFENIYAQNIKTFDEYYARIDAGEAATNVGYRMTRDDHIRKETINQIMCNLKIDKRSVQDRFGIVFDEYFASDLEKLAPFISEGLVEVDPEKISVVRSGILIVRNVAMCFDAYLEEMMKKKQVFSKTV